MSPARRRALTLLLVPLAFLGLVELGLRLFVLPNETIVWRPLPPFGRGESAAFDAWLERQEAELAAEEDTGAGGLGQFDPALGWTNRPGSASPDGAVHVNALGLRGTREYAPETPAGVLRAVACGESFTFGEEVADGEAWTARLEERWSGLEVLNLGVGGYGTDQALLRLRSMTGAIGRVDAVLVGLMLENIGRNVNRYRPLWYPTSMPAAKPRFVLAGETLELVAQPFATRAEFVAAVRSGDVLARLADREHWSDDYVPAALRWSAAARLLAAKRAYADRDLRALWADEAGEPYRTTLALLEGFRAAARELGTEHVLVLVFPTREDLAIYAARGERYWGGLFEDLARRGIAAIDLAEPLAIAARASDAPKLYRYSHLSPEGNSIVAREVHAWLEARLSRSTPARDD